MLRRHANKSRVKVLTQNIIGMYLCPESRAEIAEKAAGGNKQKGKRKKVVSSYSRVGGIALCYGNRLKAVCKTVKAEEA
jgi:hypothetical protein